MEPCSLWAKVNMAKYKKATGDQLNIDSLKAAVACLYYLQFPTEKRSEGRQFLL